MITRIGVPRHPRGGTVTHLVATIAAMAVVAPPTAAVANDPTDFRVGYGTRAADPRRDPWIAVTDATVASALTPEQRRLRRTRRIMVDYDGDGVADEAFMVRNSRQMGVIVRLGGGGRTVLAFRAEGRWSDQSLLAMGGGAIGIDFPESTIVLLHMDDGHPRVHYQPEGER